MAAAARPEPVRSGFESGLPFGLQCVADPCLVAPVRDHGNSERAQLFGVAGFWDVHPLDRTLTSVFDQLRSISFCRFLTLGQSPSCTALKILLRSRRTSCSCRCQSMESHPSAVSAGSKPSGPFAIGVQLVLWFRRLTLRRLQRLTCPRQHAFASGPACARYPASSAATPSGGAGQAVAASCHLSATGVGFLGILCSPRNSAPLAVGLPPKRRRGP